MKFNLEIMRFSPISDHHEIINEMIEADKIIFDTKAKRYEISIKELKDDKAFGFPNQFIRCLVISEKDGKRTVHGYFTKIAMYIDSDEHYLGIISIEETFFKEDVDRYFDTEYKKNKSALKVDVQTISVEDFIIQSKIMLMKEARQLFKRRRNVK